MSKFNQRRDFELRNRKTGAGRSGTHVNASSPPPRVATVYKAATAPPLPPPSSHTLPRRQVPWPFLHPVQVVLGILAVITFLVGIEKLAFNQPNAILTLVIGSLFSQALAGYHAFRRYPIRQSRLGPNRKDEFFDLFEATVEDLQKNEVDFSRVDVAESVAQQLGIYCKRDDGELEIFTRLSRKYHYLGQSGPIYHIRERPWFDLPERNQIPLEISWG